MADFHKQRSIAGGDVPEEVARDPAVRVEVVQPDSRGAMKVAKGVTPDQHALRPVELQPCHFPHLFDVQTADALHEVVLDERQIDILAAGNSTHSAVADPVAADDVTAELRRSRRLPILIAHVHAASVCPADVVLLEDPMMAAVGADHCALWDRHAVGRAFEMEPAHADVAQAALLRREELFFRRDLKGRLRGVRIAGKPEMDPQAGLLDPESAVLIGKFAEAEDLLERPAVDEDRAPPQQVLRDIVEVSIDNELLVDVPGEEGVITNERLRWQIRHPEVLGRAGASPTRTRLTAGLPLHGPTDDHLLAIPNLVGNHAVGAVTAATRTHAFTVNPLVDNYLLAGLEDLRGPVNRLERFFRRPRIRVRSLRMPPGDVVNLPIHRLVFPKRKERSVGEDDLLW